ncbi:MAG TPA: YihY family inner membrane protein, partial [Kofleriaceae bacterium]|nr:YihY family inner membrane protein [Kofleriaceae bacterium]
MSEPEDDPQPPAVDPRDIVSLPPSLPRDVRASLRERVRRIVADVERRAADSTHRRMRWPALAVRITAQVLRQWARDRCPQQAASLAFQTVLSVVPMMAVGLMILRSTGSLGEQSAFVEYLTNTFVPISARTLSQQLLEWSENVTLEALGSAGLISTALLAFIMVNSIEKTANIIWRSERKRSLAQKFVVFYSTATIGPALMATGLYQASEAGLTTGISGALLSFAATFGALFLANYFIPACPVRPSAALAGALVSTILFECSKYGFQLYVSEFAFDRYQGIYGALAVLPLWLVWIYYAWLTMLLGFEVAHAKQNLHLLERIDRRGPMSLENELLHRVNGVMAARVMMAVTEAYLGGKKVMSRRALENRFDLSDEVITRITDRLKENDLIIEVEGDHNGFLPARPPDRITLAEVLAAFRAEDAQPPGGVARSKLDKVLTDLEADAQQKTTKLTLEDLV